MAQTNFGYAVTMDGNHMGKITSVEPPSITEEKIEVTNHDSTYKEYIPTQLNDAGDMTLEVQYETTAISGFRNAKLDHSIHLFVVTAPAPSSQALTFSGFVSEFTPNAADATSPEALKCTVVISPTGPIS